MDATSRHEEVEAGFRRLVRDNGLAEPDRVSYEPDAVLFFWDAEKVCVAVDFDEVPAAYTRAIT
jgi:hypothetical protein